MLHLRDHKQAHRFLELFKYIGPGLLVTVGFIDPGNWASNLSAGGNYGYQLLWVVTLSTVMLILLQHNAAHLGIVTGYCLSEAAMVYYRPAVSYFMVGTAVIASISTAFAEILGASLALNMLFNIPVKIAVLFVLAISSILIFTNSYKRLELIIIGFVSITGISFVYELLVIPVNWNNAIQFSFTPSVPHGSIVIIMSIIGAVVMPHNLFLHSEIIQSRKWNLQSPNVISRQLKFEFLDTLFSMFIGWAINSAMIIVAAATFFSAHYHIATLQQASSMLTPIAGRLSGIIFAFALFCAGISSSITAGIAGGSIFAGFFKEPYDNEDQHSITGVLLALVVAAVILLFINDPLKALIYSQVALSIQLPLTAYLLVSLTSSKKVMGGYVNSPVMKIVLWLICVIITVLNILLLLNIS